MQENACAGTHRPIAVQWGPAFNALVWLALAVAAFLPEHAEAQNRRIFRDTSLRQVLEEVEALTPYRFLYRDALITDKTVSFDAAQEDLLDALDVALRPHRLYLQVDAVRYQILLVEAQETPLQPPATLRGQVIDDRSGARLPFATITWQENGRLRGVAANAAGTFHLPLATSLRDEASLVLTASYVGYTARQIEVDARYPPRALPIRLTPKPLLSHEVVVSSTALDAELDTTWHHLIRPGLFSPLGENSVYRSLQSLPSVSLATAFTQGLNVRGSKADGFQVLLDGIPIYNQNHFFGLFDAFNEDALQAVGFYYGITPAHFQAPPGGTLSFVTRTGSQTDTRMTTGLSNTALNTTLEGPLWGGRGSWLLSGRHSYLNAIDWFNNSDLIAQGLDVARTTSTLPRPGFNPDNRSLTLGSSSARFYDLHGKLYRESGGGNRLMVNVYLGGDHTLHRSAQRAVSFRPEENAPLRFERRLVDTRNTWHNIAASVHDQRTVGPSAFSHTLLAFSNYSSRFDKDDFLHVRRGPPDSTQANPPAPNPIPELATFNHQNDLLEWKWAQHIDASPRWGGLISTGYALHHFTVTYEEASIFRDDYDDTRRSTQVDLFSQYDRTVLGDVDLHAGLRSHYFSQGRFLRLSPRLRLRFRPQHALSWSLGYSRNYQFLHRLYLEHANSSDAWVMSTADQPPGSVDNLTAGLYVKASPTVFFQAEAYLKSYENLRQHASLVTNRGMRPESVLFTPWLPDNTGRARGLETMLRHRLGPLLWSHSYTLSKMEIQHEDLNDGAPFAADWDRRHQLTTHVQGTLRPNLTWHVTWLLASGSPNSLAYTFPSEADYLPTYHRMDASVTYHQAFRRFALEATASLYNLYDRKNIWYRTPVAVIGGSPESQTHDFVNVDVYDLGIQPSFSLSLSF